MVVWIRKSANNMAFGRSTNSLSEGKNFSIVSNRFVEKRRGTVDTASLRMSNFLRLNLEIKKTEI